MSTKTKKPIANTPVFTMREFLRSPRRASDLLRRGQKIQVTSNSELLFTAVPAKKAKRGATIKDFAHIRITGDHGPDLSKKVDEIVYGN